MTTQTPSPTREPRLRDYLQHLPICRIWAPNVGSEAPCTCGLATLLTGTTSLALACPFCSAKPVAAIHSPVVRCDNAQCPAGLWTPLEIWNRRADLVGRDPMRYVNERAALREALTDIVKAYNTTPNGAAFAVRVSELMPYIRTALALGEETKP